MSPRSRRPAPPRRPRAAPARAAPARAPPAPVVALARRDRGGRPGDTAHGSRRAGAEPGGRVRAGARAQPRVRAHDPQHHARLRAGRALALAGPLVRRWALDLLPVAARRGGLARGDRPVPDRRGRGRAGAHRRRRRRHPRRHARHRRPLPRRHPACDDGGGRPLPAGPPDRRGPAPHEYGRRRGRRLLHGGWPLGDVPGRRQRLRDRRGRRRDPPGDGRAQRPRAGRTRRGRRPQGVPGSAAAGAVRAHPHRGAPRGARQRRGRARGGAPAAPALPRTRQPAGRHRRRSDGPLGVPGLREGRGRRPGHAGPAVDHRERLHRRERGPREGRRPPGRDPPRAARNRDGTHRVARPDRGRVPRRAHDGDVGAARRRGRRGGRRGRRERRGGR